MERWSGWLWFGTVAAASIGCGGRVNPNDGPTYGVGISCVPGQQVSCPCLDRASGIQVCLTNGTFGACSCSGSTGPDSPGSIGGTETPGSSIPGSSTSGKPTGSADGGGAGSGQQLSAGASRLINVFVTDAGIIAILQDSLLLLDRNGKVSKSVSAPREITSASFDGDLLVITDRARFATYDSSLGVIASGDLAEECASSVLVANGRLVCGPKNDWDRVFQTYDARKGVWVASSKKYTYNGIPMRLVPGTSDFVTVSVDLSPSDFHLYSVSDSGEAVYINESPYHGDFRITNTYAFDGSPPVHLITDSGLLLRIHGDNCAGSMSSFSTGCFVKDGALGTLTGAQLFSAMTSDAEGKVYGLVDTSPDTFSQEHCKSGCLLERIDPVSRSIEAKTLVHLTMGEAIALRRDAKSHAVVLGYRLGTDSFYSTTDPYPGYRIVYFPD